MKITKEEAEIKKMLSEAKLNLAEAKRKLAEADNLKATAEKTRTESIKMREELSQYIKDSEKPSIFPAMVISSILSTYCVDIAEPRSALKESPNIQTMIQGKDRDMLQKELIKILTNLK